MLGRGTHVTRSLRLQGLFVPIARVEGSNVYSTTNTRDMVEAFIAVDYVQLVTTKAKC